MQFLNRNKFFSRHLPLILSVILTATALGSYYIYRAAHPTEAAWFNNINGNWGYRQRIVIDHTKVSTASSTTLSNFPVLINTTNILFKSTANGGHVSSGTGNDFVFTSDDGLTKLPHEIESYASTTGQLIAWVKVPSLSPTADVTLYIYTTAGQPPKTNPTKPRCGTPTTKACGIWETRQIPQALILL